MNEGSTSGDNKAMAQQWREFGDDNKRRWHSDATTRGDDTAMEGVAEFEQRQQEEEAQRWKEYEQRQQRR
ncbi:hypothetical protein CYMTET_29861 [Cymbomonas tetramitiformis]|uniref:Uncharacterized protein n=1 Tax=Cymbomonas tetramitiformis TaxID=36881 RepID=A0AAE0FK80_9CHLO|nr:hypothetical protein CYMTET_29861 [Cymbomonas tetramitiformis]